MGVWQKAGKEAGEEVAEESIEAAAKRIAREGGETAARTTSENPLKALAAVFLGDQYVFDGEFRRSFLSESKEIVLDVSEDIGEVLGLKGLFGSISKYVTLFGALFLIVMLFSKSK